MPAGEGTSTSSADASTGVPREWNVNSFGQSEATFDGGTLTISTQGDGMGSDVWWMVSRFPMPVAGTVAADVVETSPADSGGSVWLELRSAGVTLSFAVRGAEIRTSIQPNGDPYVVQDSGAYDPVDDRWLRISYDSVSTSVVAQTSPDGLTWTTFHEFDTTGFEFDDFDIDLGGGTFDGSMYAGVVASVAQVAVCED